MLKEPKEKNIRDPDGRCGLDEEMQTALRDAFMEGYKYAIQVLQDALVHHFPNGESN